ncbi:DUF2516 family protein [Arthrobacter sp. 35W]|uniref:DUF2516 family protein n=1 Tax=Arthrobacter sp. 35W TaxID=1132441 RepID=UPI000428AF98|nr:DUF2516 family protein [Arthrobacter sp. 35W]
MIFFITNALLILLGLVALGIQGWALADCLRTKTEDFERAYKRTKSFWALLTGGSALMGVLYIAGPGMGFSMLLNLAAVTAASVYLADVRPALAQVRRGGNRNQGPYGPW